jgi:DNA-binding transcriptional LysR family regulator
MLDLNPMAMFVRVVQAGSFSAAARELSVPKSTLSRKVSELEARLGARLLQRTTRRLGLTDAGRVYFDQGVRIVASAQEAEASVGRLQSAPRGVLRVSAPASFGLLGPIVAEYLREHADVVLELVASDRAVDLVEENFDVALRAGALADSTLVARAVGSIKRVLVAEPNYCKTHGTPAEPADLEQHAAITFGSGTAPNVWALEAGEKRVEVRVRPRLAVNDFDIMRAAALAGVGIAWLPEFVCADDIRRRRLRRVLPAWCSAEVPLHAVYPSSRHLAPKVGVFVALLAARLRAPASLALPE